MTILNRGENNCYHKMTKTFGKQSENALVTPRCYIFLKVYIPAGIDSFKLKSERQLKGIEKLLEIYMKLLSF